MSDFPDSAAFSTIFDSFTGGNGGAINIDIFNFPEVADEGTFIREIDNAGEAFNSWLKDNPVIEQQIDAINPNYQNADEYLDYLRNMELAKNAAFDELVRDVASWDNNAINTLTSIYEAAAAAEGISVGMFDISDAVYETALTWSLESSLEDFTRDMGRMLDKIFEDQYI